jgi:ABC-2 type transport system permease protein
MGQMRRVWFIALNNLRLFVTDRLAVGMFILFPFLFIVMFNILLGNTTTQDQPLELHLVTQETDGISQQIIQGLVTTDPSSLSPGAPIIVWDKDYNQAKADVEAGKFAGFLAFPVDFTRAIENGSSTSLEIVSKGDATATRPALTGLAQGIISQVSAVQVEIHSVMALMAQQGSSPADIQIAVAQIMSDLGTSAESQPLISYQANDIGAVKPVNASSYVVPGYLVMFVFFAAAIASVDIIRERNNHTLERLLASSVRKESILGGIYLGAVFRGLVQIAIFWTMGILVFHVDLGVAPWAVVVLSLLMVAMSAAFSVMLATLVKTERGASALAVLCSLLLAPLGGCWWPLFIDPRWMQFLAKFTPHGWANEGFNKLMLFGASAGDVSWQMLALVGFGVAFIIIAIINFRTSGEAT